MARLTDMAAVLRAAGCTVVEVVGWQARGRNLVVRAIIWHHTATGPNWADSRVVDLLVKGRPDLPGPLSQLGLDRQGRYWLVAAGRANHNGYGLHGNNSIGIEAFNSGVGEPWPAAQVNAYVRGAAALGRAYGVPVALNLGHKESDPRRKIDPHGLDMPTMRRRVAAINSGKSSPPTPTPTPGGFLMSLTAAQQKTLFDRVAVIHKLGARRPVVCRDTKARVNWIVDGFTRSRMPPGQPVLAMLVVLGQVHSDIIQLNTDDQRKWLGRLPVVPFGTQPV